MRAIPVLLAVLLVCAAVGGGAAPVVGGGATSAGDGDRAVSAPADSDTSAAAGSVTATNHTNASGHLRVLSLNDSARSVSDIDVVTVDAGTSVDLATNASAARIETIALRNRIERANTSDERQIRILDGLNEVDKDVVTLHARQRDAIAAYESGELTARELLIELSRIRASAAVLEERIAVLRELADESDDVSIDDNRVFPLLYDLRTFDGPVRERTGDALAGERDASTRVYVAATEDGIVLSTVTDGEYVREAFRGDLRERGEGINEEVAQNVTARSYPEIYAATGGNVAGQGSGGTFLFDLRYANGSLTAFVGGGTERVFMEHQRIDLAGVDTDESVSRNLDIALTVNRTFPGGPLRVEATDPATGEPVNAVVKIGREGGESTDVGTTGDDGVLWTVGPDGQFVVTVVEVGSTEVSTVSVTPTAPHTVADALASSDGSTPDDEE
ncbi:hypothetical protein Hbl1158_04995 [Halobaculum sp. CBA1158]|uniref:DUF7096 domain-containing protein n=1 Tax=Halobaculum sp. CBA1158 TaxID=2904243 RepID=UPI001F3D56C4|nr:hypothetical protein [Halobaculum sp. CBA1158]UIP00716.1 hypothetical protein Hbl1158_04995 [Halobaculum sp. CBA1158]